MTSPEGPDITPQDRDTPLQDVRPEIVISLPEGAEFRGPDIPTDNNIRFDDPPRRYPMPKDFRFPGQEEPLIYSYPGFPPSKLDTGLIPEAPLIYDGGKRPMDPETIRALAALLREWQPESDAPLIFEPTLEGGSGAMQRIPGPRDEAFGLGYSPDDPDTAAAFREYISQPPEVPGNNESGEQ